MGTLTKMIIGVFAVLVAILGLVAILVWATTFHPSPKQAEAVDCRTEMPTLQPGQSLKVMTYNVQYMAGKNYFFFYEGGSHERPLAEDIGQTLERIADIVREEEPDVILLQEVDDGSKRTDYEDQLAQLLQLLPPEYGCHVSAYYWQADFVPHPQIWGAIGHKMSIISKYRLDQATRYQLPLTSADPLTQQFSPKRAILEARLPVAGAQDFFILTTHLEVANRGADIMRRQVGQVDEHLQSLSQAGHSWLIGGDFNLLPPGQFEQLRPDQQPNFRPETELAVLFENHHGIPSLADTAAAGGEQWFTFLPNDPTIQTPDRTLDYIFFSDAVTPIDGFVRHDNKARLASDHLPVIAELKLP